MATISQKKLIHDLNYLLNAEFSPELFDSLGAYDIIEAKLAKNSFLFQQKIGELKKISAEADLYSLLHKKLVKAEKQLADYFKDYSLYTPAGYRRIIDNIFKRVPDKFRQGFFIKAAAAEGLLKQNPPKSLMNFFNLQSISNLFKILLPLDAITISRYTENPDWQLRYKDLLAQATAQDFEARPINYLIFDYLKYRQIINNSRQPQKPWRLSHNKVTGSIICFTIEGSEVFAAPFLQSAAVLLHYYFETAYAGGYYALVGQKNPGQLGIKVLDSFTNHDGKFPFFSPNVYSETLYWEKALASLSNEFNCTELKFFAETIDCGGFYKTLSGLKALSFNLIDHIWNINLAPAPWLYHFREAWWKNAFQEMIKLTNEDFEQEILNHLSLKDLDFTKQIIKKITGK